MTFEIDRDHDILPYSKVCSRCIHLVVESASAFKAERPTGRCKTFPAGIPLEIWSGDNPHTEPFDGDGGVRFESANTQS